MFTAALFTIARTREQPRWPLADEWIRRLWHVYAMEYYSAIKKNTSLEKEMATHSSILAWKSPWTEESGGLKSMGLHD